MNRRPVKAVIFDFGGVLAEEGFREGLMAIGRKNNLDPDAFFTTADALIYETGYLTGRADEASFWGALREKTGIAGTDAELREEILTRFAIRPRMIAHADRLRSMGFIVAVLSDQTNWLDEIEQETLLFRHFDQVFNSFRIHKSKRDPSVFKDVCMRLGVHPHEALLVDDNPKHIERAAAAGLHTIRFTNVDDFERQITEYLASQAPVSGRVPLSKAR